MLVMKEDMALQVSPRRSESHTTREESDMRWLKKRRDRPQQEKPQGTTPSLSEKFIVPGLVTLVVALSTLLLETQHDTIEAKIDGVQSNMNDKFQIVNKRIDVLDNLTQRLLDYHLREIEREGRAQMQGLAPKGQPAGSLLPPALLAKLDSLVQALHKTGIVPTEENRIMAGIFKALPLSATKQLASEFGLSRDEFVLIAASEYVKAQLARLIECAEGGSNNGKPCLDLPAANPTSGFSGFSKTSLRER